MIAMALSLTLIGAVTQLFLANKATYQLNNAIAHMQENARYSATLITQDIRMAGHQGCASRNSQTPWKNHLSYPTAAYTPARGIEGWETATMDTSIGHYTVTSDSPVTDASKAGWKTSHTNSPQLDDNTFAVAQTDIIRIWRTTGDSVSGIVQDNSFQANKTPPYAARDMLLLTDCSGAELAMVCSLSGKVAKFACLENQSFTLPNPTSGLQAYQYSGWLYYVGKRSKQAHNPPSLYRRAINKNALAETAQEIVEGIESLQILYGEDTADPSGTINQYVTADQVSDWQQVISVQIGLLLRSTEKVLSTDEPQHIDFNGTIQTANDGYLRYPFNFSVALRNRLP
jgi:type IV pilus assembly protein PilW